MALTPLKIALLLGFTLLCTIVGVLCIATGVHGPQAIAWLGDFLLLPSILLLRLGVPIGIPILYSTTIFSLIVFLLLQTAYYYVLLLIVLKLINRARRRTSTT